MRPSDLGQRIRAFERELDRRCAEQVGPSRFGTAYVNLSFPDRYDSNFVRVDAPLEELDAEAVAADADRTLGRHGLRHGHVYVDDGRRSGALAAEFLDLGWSAEPLLVMARLREPESRPSAPVREVGFAEARPFLEEVLRRQPNAENDEVVRQLCDFRAVLERETGARFFVAEAEGRPAAICELYLSHGVAQVEDVNTLEEFRGRGLASAVVLAATAAARDRGAEVVFLVADDADWPKTLYARLGFRDVSRFWSFLRTPA